MLLRLGRRRDPSLRLIQSPGESLPIANDQYDAILAECSLSVMQHPDRAFTRGELIDAAVGYGYEGLERTIDSHIKNLRKKIEVDPARPEYLETVFGVGYRLRE
jgi:DNA-binding response OmpR family regulator